MALLMVVVLFARPSIVCTIHQSPTEPFHVFDKLLFLKEGGQDGVHW